jgi:hypothetical protein
MGNAATPLKHNSGDEKYDPDADANQQRGFFFSGVMRMRNQEAAAQGQKSISMEKPWRCGDLKVVCKKVLVDGKPV